MDSSAKIAMEMHNDYNDVLSGIGCFKGTFPFQIKEGTKLYQAPS